jgi:S-adenosylmethionine decarboxylase proenzyme
MMKELGRHVLVEMYDCDPLVLNDRELIRKAMVEAAERAKASVVGESFHNFLPHGVSGVVVIAESHLSIHTWPEYSFAALDLFTCGDEVDPWFAFDHLRVVLKAGHSSQIELKRGQFPLEAQKLRPFKPDI